MPDRGSVLQGRHTVLPNVDYLRYRYWPCQSITVPNSVMMPATRIMSRRPLESNPIGCNAPTQVVLLAEVDFETVSTRCTG
jgi:hypothetical protein